MFSIESPTFDLNKKKAITIKIAIALQYIIIIKTPKTAKSGIKKKNKTSTT